jgi:hypothetical protein
MTSCPASPAAVRLLGVSSLLLGCLSPALQAAPQTPLVTTGYNQDVIIENTAINQPGLGYGNYVTASMDGNVAKTSTTFYEIGLNTLLPATGFPLNGSTFTSEDNPNLTFQLQPYTQNNTLLLTRGQTGTLTLSTPVPLSSVSFLVTTAKGGGTDALTLHFSDGTPNYTALTLTAPSWFDNSPVALTAHGRVDVPTGGFNSAGTDNPRLYQTSFDLAALGLSGHPLASVDFTYTGDGNSGVFAISGGVVPEPSSALLVCFFGVAALGGVAFARRRVR